MKNGSCTLLNENARRIGPYTSLRKSKFPVSFNSQLLYEEKSVEGCQSILFLSFSFLGLYTWEKGRGEKGGHWAVFFPVLYQFPRCMLSPPPLSVGVGS
jgi:hypothetical protein